MPAASSSTAPPATMLLRPRHPYTVGMLNSIVIGQERGKDIEAIPGAPPDLRFLPRGCSFAARCRAAVPDCGAAVPPPSFVAPGQYACCIRAHDPVPSERPAALRSLC